MSPQRLIGDWLPEVLATLFYPLLHWQGRRTRARSLRLEGPSGPGEGITSASTEATPAQRALRLLVVGESPVAGIGVETWQQSVAATTAAALSRKMSRTIIWSACGCNGATVAEWAQRCASRLPIAPVDIVCIAFGVNDSTAFRSVLRWKQDLESLIEVFLNHAGAPLIVVSGVPPLHRFPALPAPLRWVLGMKSAALDRALRDLVCQYDSPRIRYAPLPQQLSDPRLMAADGYHPSASGCLEWGAALSDACELSFISAGQSSVRQQ